MADGKRIAVIGSGITGLGAAWLLTRSGAQVTLYEKEEQCGGHTLTDTTSPYPVDLGFQVYNLTTYPHLVAFLDALGVDTEPSDMSFALSMDGGKLEWASHNLSTVFAQRSNLLKPSFWRMLWDVVRFGREAPKVLEPAQAQLYRGMDMATYLKRNGYSQAFIRHYLLPMCAAVWSVPNGQVLTFPVQMLVRFWTNHHLLDLTQRPLWRVVKGRSRAYVERVLEELSCVHTSCPVLSVRRAPATPKTPITPRTPFRQAAGNGASCSGGGAASDLIETDKILIDNSIPVGGNGGGSTGNELGSTGHGTKNDDSGPTTSLPHIGGNNGSNGNGSCRLPCNTSTSDSIDGLIGDLKSNITNDINTNNNSNDGGSSGRIGQNGGRPASSSFAGRTGSFAGRSSSFIGRSGSYGSLGGSGTIRRDVVAGAGGVIVTTAEGGEEEFDGVVFATHSDITLRLLGADADDDEKRILGAIPYNENDIYLHTDASLMPVDRRAWASWNFIGRSSDSDSAAVCCSYWVNHLQALPDSAPDMFVTLNPLTPPAAEKVIRRLQLAHPVFSAASWQAQDLLPGLQGRRGAYFAGAWAGYGFHEDGLKAAIAAVHHLGANVPWVPRSTSPKVSMTQRFFLSLFDKFASAAITTGRLRVILPDGSERLYGKDDEDSDNPGGPGEEWRGRPPLRATMRVYTYDMFRKVVLRHDTGLGEAYMERMFDVDDLGALMAVVTANAVNAEVSRGAMGWANWLGDRLLYRQHRTRGNTVSGSRKNIEGHYDSGNAMYRLFLDESLTYSAGVHRPGDSLYQAQLNKMDAIIAKAGLCATDNVLEIGCGWGGFAIRAVQTTGCRVTGVTLSKEQLSEAQARVRAAGLSDRITLLFCDYRDHAGVGTYSKVVSIEMIEAVGQEHLHSYFAAIGRFLQPGGTAVIQAICVADQRYAAYCRTSDFIRAHIFPGGHLPSMGAMIEAARGTGLSAHDVSDIGPDYAMTLREWRRRWEACEKELRSLGYSDEYWRKFRFYFAYCEAGFDARFIHDFHVVWLKDQQVETVTVGVPSNVPTVTAYITSPPSSGAPAAVPMAPDASSKVSSPTAATAIGRSRAPCSQVGDARYHIMSTGIIANPDEMPNDTVTQGLVVLYIYLSCLVVRKHPAMWLIPLAALVATVTNSAVHHLSNALLPFYRNLNLELRAWWCADVVHLLFSFLVSACALFYAAVMPRSLLLADAPNDDTATLPITLCAAVTGFFAFHLWAFVRNRLFARTTQAIVQYTVLLTLFGVATYKKVCLPFLCVTLVSEISTVFFLAGKLRHLAGVPGQDRVLSFLETATLLVCRLALHGYVTVVVVGSPGAFTHPLFYAMSTLGMVYCNYINLHRANALQLKLASVSAVVVGAAVAASVLGVGKA